MFIFFFFPLQLAAIKLGRYGEDLLFYLYYMNGGDVLQLLAAVELYVQISVNFVLGYKGDNYSGYLKNFKLLFQMQVILYATC